MSFTSSILIFRFSAMGDVAMSAAVIREFALQNQHTRIIMVSRGLFAPFFADIENLVFHPLDPKNKHKGIYGLFTLFRELRVYKPTAVADLHNNLRSRVLSFFFRLTGTPIARLDKARSMKKAMTARTNKVHTPLLPVTEAYADVFSNLGFSLTLSHRLNKYQRELPSKYSPFFSNSKQKKIGISPFAQHIQKIYPLAKMEQVIEALVNEGYQLFVFGGGPKEELIAEDWGKKFPNVENLIGKLTLQEELDLISHLDLMVSMDSAGMHLASLMGIKVISIWGATHPNAGFLGYGQQEHDCIQIDLHCRPCSVYGNKPCYRGDFACMQGINSGIIIAQIKETLNHD